MPLSPRPVVLTVMANLRPRVGMGRARPLCTAAEIIPALTLRPTEHSAARNADPDAVFAVSGASRGIGLEFCRSILARSRGRVIAMSRSPDESSGLQDLERVYPGRVLRLPVDVLDESSILRAGDAARQLVPHVDVVVNCVGVLHEGRPDRMPERSLAACRASWMQDVYAVNALGPVLITSALLPLLTARCTRAKVVANLSARVSSVSDNRLGGWWGYRMSKAALNMATKNMALELKRRRVIAIALHPGTTDTGLSKPFQRNVRPEKLFSTQFAVQRLLDVVESAEEIHSGSLFAWDGERIPF